MTTESEKIMVDVIGKTFGRLTVVEEGERKGKERTLVCLCECGNMRTVFFGNLKSGKTKSCGCLRKEKIREANKTVADEDKRLHRIWMNMKARCLYPSVQSYKYYGGRGITFCKEWNEFKPFRDWARRAGYGDDLSIDRIDNDGNYCPENCRWVTRIEQMNNKRCSRYVEFNGEKKTVAEWARDVGVDERAMWDRLFKQNMPIERAVTSPNMSKKHDKKDGAE